MRSSSDFLVVSGAGPELSGAGSESRDAGPELSDAGPESSADNDGIGMAGSGASGSRLEEALVGMFEEEDADGGLLLLLDTVVFGAVTASRFAPGSNDFEPEFA